MSPANRIESERWPDDQDAGWFVPAGTGALQQAPPWTTIGAYGFPDEEGRLRYPLAVIVLAALASMTSLDAQEATGLLSFDARLSDFGLDHLDDIMRGRISLVHDPAGDRIALHFLRDSPTAGATAAQPSPALPAPAEGPVHRGLKALWVWNTAEILDSPPERDRFLDLIETEGIGRVFLYVPAADGTQPAAGYIPFDSEALAPLLAGLHSRGALTYALDGDPDYVLEENHDGVLRTIERVAEHNRLHRPEEGFFGVRYDVEPYLVAGFQGPRRQQILDGYVALLDKVAVTAHRTGLAVGADIPFWFDAGDEETGEPFEAVLNGVRGPVLGHVMASVDDVAIMAYRTAADGPNGVLFHASGEISQGRGSDVGVFVGVETTHLFDEELFTFRGAPRVGLPTLRDATWVVIEDRGEDLVRVWLAPGAAALEELARRTRDPGLLRTWFAGQPVPLPGDLLSFYSLGPDAMEALVQRVVRQFGEDPAFRGLAYHDYRGLSALRQR